MSNEKKNMVEIEINGVKMEVDLRTARRVETLQVGTKVKVLVKKYQSHEIHPGVIVGFEPFQKLPTIVVAYIESSYSSVDLKFLYYNSKSADEVEIVASVDEVLIEQPEIEAVFAREIAKHDREIAALKEKRDYFRRNFKAYWSALQPPAPMAEDGTEPKAS